MTESKLQSSLSIFLLVSHVCVPLVVLALFVMRCFEDKEFSMIMAILLPMLGTISGLAFNYILASRTKPMVGENSVKVSSVFAFAAFFLAILFVSAILTLVVLRAYRVLHLEPFKISLGATETIFGAYTGKVLSSVFNKDSHG